jgi:hypothetical protein
MTSLCPASLRHRLATTVRAVGGAGLFATGIFTAGAFTSNAPAAPQDCLPVVGCVTTILPTVSVPGVTLPTLPTTPGITTATSTTTTQGGSPPSSKTTTTKTESATPPGGGQGGAAAFNPRATVRVRGRGARRVVEIKVNLTKPARLSALLSRKGGSIAKRLFTAKAGKRLFRLRIGRTTKAGLANLSLAYRATSGEAARTTHRLWLPR